MSRHSSNFVHFVIMWVARWMARKNQKWIDHSVEIQSKTLFNLIRKAKNTSFGKDHGFEHITTYEDFKNAVPVREYEEYGAYFEKLKNGDHNVLWPGKPIYFCKTSGTTSGTKYIPITRASMPNFVRSARNAVLQYILNTGNSSVLDGNFIFVQGSPVLKDLNGIKTGRLSGIVAHHVPFYLQRNRKPSFPTNSIDDWEQKIEAIVDETIDANMTAVGGIPPWVQMYFESLLGRAGKKKIKDIFPNLQLMVTGGVNFDPYEKTFESLVGLNLDKVETYPASEGFFAYQDTYENKGLLLLANEKIFYEFIKADEVSDINPRRISLADVELNTNYALVLNSSAGLWAYLIGDTVMFTSLQPYRIKVTGRIKHFTSAFGEHVIAEEVEYALKKTMEKHHCEINEFTIAPMVNPPHGETPYHEWFIEFKSEPDQLDLFGETIDQYMQQKNSYYRDLIMGQMLQPLKISRIRTNGFNSFMNTRGKLGGQNKVPRLSNDRKIAEDLKDFILNQ